MQQKLIFQRIQILRFVAAASVVAYHAQLTTVSYFGGAKPYPLLELGVYGVDLFFVISGFIIVFIGSLRETDPRIFAKRRIERIVPLYWIMTLATFALTHIPGLARNEVFGPVRLIQSLLFVSWLNGPETYPVLNVGWTLEFEMLFYIVAAAAMLITAWFRGSVSAWRWPIAAAVMLLLVLSGHGTPFFLQNPIMIEFVFGMTIGTFLYDRRSFFWMLGGTALVMATLPMTGPAWRVWAFGLPSAGLVSLVIFADLRKTYKGRVLPELGNASYSIYLTHVVAISFVCKIASVAMPRVPTAVITPLITLFAIAIGYIAYRLIENPLLQAMNRRRRAAVSRQEQAMPVGKPDAGSNALVSVDARLGHGNPPNFP